MGQSGRPATTQSARLMKRGYALLQKGQFPQARLLYDQARSAAIKAGDHERANKAASGISACLIEMGEYEQAAKGLREIILRSTDDETICAAACNLSTSLRRLGQHQKAFVYAKKAYESSRALGDPSWQARCHNLIGNIYLVQSRLDKALAEYEKALALRLKEPVPNTFSIAILRDNIGYCQMLNGDYRRGIANVKAALSLVSRLGSRKCICECAHDLSFGYMQLRKLDLAEAYGLRALEIADKEGYKEIIKNCYYLLGEINFLKGNEEMRDHYFYKLQDLYPHLPFLRDFLCTFDVSKIIALRFPQ